MEMTTRLRRRVPGDPYSGKTWTGRGKPPAWIAGRNREKFLIAD
jgi:DNA-binding protein H-NS